MVSGKARGGHARAKSLTSEERRAIGRNAARARWDSTLPQAICGAPDRPLRIAEQEIQCYVLEDDTRVLTQSGFLEALGRHRRAYGGRGRNGSERVPRLLQGVAIRPYISEELIERAQPIAFRTPEGARASGYRAELLPEVCDIYLRAREDRVLPRNQQHIARQAELLMRGLAHVGIIALVDEATGYQEVRARDALNRILEAFIARELQPWLSTFPPDFYNELFRLRGLEFPTDTVKRPQYFGHLTNDMIYRRLAPGVLDELKRVTPRTADGRLRHKYFQRLTSNIGYPKLREHLGSVMAIMKLSNTWQDFQERLDRLHPRHDSTLRLPLDFEEGDDGHGL